MKARTIPCRMLLALALVSSISFTNHLAHAQNAPHASQSSQTAQQPAVKRSGQSADQDTEKRTSRGVIAKSGDRLVPTDLLTQASYHLDPQRRAREFVNKNVKVTGVFGSLDESNPRERDQSDLRDPMQDWLPAMSF